MPLSEKLLQNPGALCNMVRRIAVEAGHITLKYHELVEPHHIDEKGDGSPVTQADHEAEEHIERALRELTPAIPVVAEESVGKGNIPDLSERDYFWLVDPVDATKEFIACGDNYTVNIGLVHRAAPVLGVVYAPALGILYAGFEGRALRWSEDAGKDKSIHVRTAPSAGLTVMSSQNHADDASIDKFLQSFKVEKILKRPSSLKICMVAEGKADMYPRFGPTYQWDTAAGEAILRAAGGTLTGMDGAALAYGRDGRFENPHFVAASFEWFGQEES